VQVVNLIAVSRLRRAAVKAGLSEVVAMGTNLRVAPGALADSDLIDWTATLLAAIFPLRSLVQ
jgi:hypothetical protein